MKEQIHTIPINDAMANAGECPFCYIEKRAEERLLDFTLGAGASYMEADIREKTDTAGFCRAHYKKLFAYGNALGNAWMLKTHYRRLNDEMAAEFKSFKPGKADKKPKLFGGVKNSEAKEPSNPIAAWCKRKEATCFVCDSLKKTFDAYVDTFFTMYKKDDAFKRQLQQSKGFCITHFGDLCEAADRRLKEAERKEFYDTMLPLQQMNMERLYEDVAWFIEKYDYKNKDADWKDSKDAIQRGMQKLKGGYPAEPFYQMKK